MSYNLLAYQLSDTTRDQYFRTTIAYVKPDILVVQEVGSQTAADNFRSNVISGSGVAEYQEGTFIHGVDTDNGVYFRTGKIQFISNTPIKTRLRDINEFKFYHAASAETLRVYAAHLKASSGSANDTARAAEVDSLRRVTDALPRGSNFMVMGDFNIYSSNELSYQRFLRADSGNEGYFIDPVSITGTWNNPTYAPYHTQSTRVRAFGGGATGGLDDRFDVILFSRAVSDTGGITYVLGSFQAIGNDGNHYNDSINQMPNTSVPLEVANALHNGSDHLPVMARFVFTRNPESIVADESLSPLTFILRQNYPNPFNPTTTVSYTLAERCPVHISISNILGQIVQTFEPGEQEPGSHSVVWDATSDSGAVMSSGVYILTLKSGGTQRTIRMLLLR